jgi:RNA polymerase sigma-70 factor (ECF subfamily)
MPATSASTATWAGRLLLAVSSGAAAEGMTQRGPAPAHLDSLRQGEPESWRLLFDEESPGIYRYAYSRLGQPEDAEDVTNQVFEEAWRSIGRYRETGLPLRAWLFGIARNLASSHRRRFMSRNAQISVDGLQVEGQSDVAQAEAIDLVKALTTLEAGQAETISLRFIHDLSLAETAAVLGVTVDAVKGRQQRALAALKQRLGR